MEEAAEGSSRQIIGICLALAAGLCTGIGAAVVFLPWKVNRLWLVSCLALSSAVMIFVSLSELYVDSIISMEKYLIAKKVEIKPHHIKAVSRTIATASFALGCGLTALLDYVLGLCLREPETIVRAESNQTELCGKADILPIKIPIAPKQTKFSQCCAKFLCTSKNEKSMKRADRIQRAEEDFERDTHTLYKMGIVTGLVLAAHNLPEGIATYASALSSKELGFALAVGIGIHNIPEGLAVALPLYYATGKRWKPFFFALGTGLAEPVGAFIGYLSFGSNPNDLMLCLALATVAGIMTSVAINELVPQGVLYDPCNEVFSKFFIIGIVIMCFSIVMLELGGIN